MIKNLYPIFQYWSATGSVYLIGDTHFADSDCQLMDPDWPDPDTQVDIINSVVKSTDTLVLLGDVGDISYVKKLKAGYKVLITGNHDGGASKYEIKSRIRLFPKADFSTLKDAMNEALKDNPNMKITDAYEELFSYVIELSNGLFDEVYTGPLTIAEKIILSHEPINSFPYALNIHGHVHQGSLRINEYDLNVASDVIKYVPLSLGDLIKQGIVKQVPGIHRFTIDKAKENPIHKEQEEVTE